MACPWFEPLTEASAADRPTPARAPLGKLFEGRCHSPAVDGLPVQPGEAAHYEACNFGYGRSTCPLFPPDGEADAVRFTEHAGRMVWILEKEYAPLRHGVVGDEATGPLLARQAEVFQRACLNR